MNKLLAALLLIPSLALADGPYILPWEQVTEIYFTPSQVRMYGPGALQSLVGVPDPVGCQSQNTWCEADLTLYGVPTDAKYAFMSGLLLITHGTNAQQADYQITFKKPGTTGDCSKYLGQTVEPHTGGGQRSNMSTWVPLSEGKTEFCFRYNAPAAWPNWSSYGVNLSVQAWAR